MCKNFFFSTFATSFDDSTTTETSSTESAGSGSEGDGCLEIEESIDDMLEKVTKKLCEAKLCEGDGCAGELPAAVKDKKGGEEVPPLIDLTASDDENPDLGN